MPLHLFVRTEKELRRDTKKFRTLLAQAACLKFFRAHFARRNFRYDPEKFTWEYWKTVPFLTKNDFRGGGLAQRVHDASPLIKKSAYNVSVHIGQGTSGKKPVLVCVPVGMLPPSYKGKKGILWCMRGLFMVGLRFTICALKNQDNILMVDRPYLDERAGEAIAEFAEFGADIIGVPPANVAKLANLVKQYPKIMQSATIVRSGGEFLTREDRRMIHNTMRVPRIIRGAYGISEVGILCGVSLCAELEKKYGKKCGLNAFHPKMRDFLLELVDIDPYGYGEVVVTRAAPNELAVIRYRTGDIGKAIFKRCSCGAEITFLLMGRKGWDYFICAGLQITRLGFAQEMEKFKKWFKEWRAEMREVRRGETVRGELTLTFAPRFKKQITSMDAKRIKEKITKDLKIDRISTLADLITRGKFTPLKIKTVKSFPVTGTKRLPLRFHNDTG